MTIPEQAVHAALATVDIDDTYVGEADHLGQFVIDGPVNIKSMLTAALPFLTGLKFDPWGWVIPRGGDKKPIILEASKFDQASAAAEADIHDLGYFPIYTQPVSAPSPRAQALEEGDLQELLERLDAGLEYEGDLETENNHIELFNIEAAQELFSDAAAAIRALSSQPVADHADAGKLVEGKEQQPKIAAWMVRKNEHDTWDFCRLKKVADDLTTRGFEVVPLYTLPSAPSEGAE